MFFRGLLSRVMRTLGGVRERDGRDLQLRLDTAKLYRLTRSATERLGRPESLERNVGWRDLQEDSVAGAANLPTFEEQAEALRVHLIGSTLKSLRAVSRAASSCEHVPGQSRYNDAIAARVKEALGFTLRIKPSGVAGAGLGVFVDGTAPEGSLLTLYPGKSYLPSEVRHLPGFPAVSDSNDFLMWRYDGVIIDGMDAVTALQHSDDGEPRRAAFDDDEGSPALKDRTARDITAYAHPFATGHLINHPPKGMDANGLQFMLDLETASMHEEVRKFVPNSNWGSSRNVSGMESTLEALEDTAMRQRVPSTSAFRVRGKCKTSSRLTLAILATRTLIDEEVFINYRFNPRAPTIPSWYHDCDPDTSVRRWKAEGLLA